MADVDNSAWDGNAAMVKAGEADDPAAAFKAICAGRKAGPADQRGSWALPHHKAQGDPPNADGVRNSLSRLPQTQGLTNEAAAQDHLDAHLSTIQAEADMKFSAPRDDLIRMTPLAISELRVEPAGEGSIGTLTGYAAVFNQDTVIDSWEGKFVERIAPGAFRKTLASNGDRVKVLFNHGFDPSIGDKPLGKPSVQKEDKTGLRVEVPLDDTSYNRDLVASLRSGALDGQSFRFSVVRESWTEPDQADDLPIRILNEVKLYEYGPVTFPAYEATTAGVRARDAYLAWRTAHPSGAADPGTSDTPADAADPGTSAVPAPTRKERAQAISRAKEIAYP